MPDMNKFMGNTEASRAKKVWQRIAERPANIVIVRGRNVTLAAQTLRVEYATAARDHDEGGSVSVARDVIVYGVKNHPDVAVPDSDIQRNDRFMYNGQQWLIESIVTVLGGIQARGVVQS